MKLRPQLETLYCESNGRPAIDTVLLCGVTLFQFMEKVSDRRAAEQVAYHLGWKYALELELAYQGFHPTVLVYFRDRLEENQAEMKCWGRPLAGKSPISRQVKSAQTFL